jgi:hypothetical protein
VVAGNTTLIELNPHPNPPPSLILEKGEGRERDEFFYI